MTPKVQEQPSGVFRQTLPATYHAIDEAATAITAHFLARATKRDQFNVRLLLCEALTNAVRHGCAGNATLNVVCEAWQCDACLHLRVADPGPGFDWQTMLRRHAQPLQCHGHGLQIVRQYADTVAFNAAGNELTLTYRLTGGHHGNV